MQKKHIFHIQSVIVRFQKIKKEFCQKKSNYKYIVSSFVLLLYFNSQWSHRRDGTGYNDPSMIILLYDKLFYTGTLTGKEHDAGIVIV